MSKDRIDLIKDKLKGGAPLHELSLIREVGDIKWGEISSADMGTACEVLLRISADVIICANDTKGKYRGDYKDAFDTVVMKIGRSGLIGQSREFDEYYAKMIAYMSDFDL